MATVYKIEMEVVSHWINVNPKDIENHLIKSLEDYLDAEDGNEVDFPKAEVKRKA